MVLVRDPDKVVTQSAHLKLLPGSMQDAAQMEEAINGAEAIPSVLGPTHNRPTYEISAATGNIIAAMRRHGVRWLIVAAGAGVGDLNDAPGAFDRLIGLLLRLFSRNIYEDMAWVVAEVRASSLDWTIVGVPMLRDGPHTGIARIGYVDKGAGLRPSRANLADFMLQQLTDGAYSH
jgi:putative NADH-flavin reductase